MKKLSVYLLTVIFCLTALTPAWAQEDGTAGGKIGEIEKLLYGTVQAGSIMERADNLEIDINGSATGDALLVRIDRMYSYVKGKPGNTFSSFMTKLNTIEWLFDKKLSEGPAKSRLEAIEKSLQGQEGSGSLDDRMDALVRAIFPGGDIEVQEVVLPKDQLIKISIAQELSSKTVREGDAVLFRAEDNIYIGNVLVIPKGALGNGVVAKASRARNFGRSGKIEIEYTDIKAIDDSKVLVHLDKLAQQEAEKLAIAAGASMAGLIILGPVGVIGGAFIKGKEYYIPEGALLYVQVKEDMAINGVAVPDELMDGEYGKAADQASGGL